MRFDLMKYLKGDAITTMIFSVIEDYLAEEVNICRSGYYDQEKDREEPTLLEEMDRNSGWFQCPYNENWFKKSLGIAPALFRESLRSLMSRRVLKYQNRFDGLWMKLNPKKLDQIEKAYAKKYDDLLDEDD